MTAAEKGQPELGKVLSDCLKVNLPGILNAPAQRAPFEKDLGDNLQKAHGLFKK